MNNNDISHLIKKDTSAKTINPKKSLKNTIKGKYEDIKGSEYVKKTSDAVIKIAENYNDTVPFLIRVIYILLAIGLTYYYTLNITNFNLKLSLLFGVMSFLLLFLLNKIIAFIFLAMYIFFLVKIFQYAKYLYGNPINETNIIRNRRPLNCSTNSEDPIINRPIIISNKKLVNDGNQLNFSYSFWIYVNNLSNINPNTWINYKYDEWKSVFNRGDENLEDSGNDMKKGFVKDSGGSNTQFPGVWLSPTSNNLVISFQSPGSLIERIEINDIDLNTWTNVVINVNAGSVSVFINGLLDRIVNINQLVPDMNNYNLYIGDDAKLSNGKRKGFPGYLGQLAYYPYTLNQDYITDQYIYYKRLFDEYKMNMIPKTKYNLPTLVSDIKNKCG